MYAKAVYDMNTPKGSDNAFQGRIQGGGGGEGIWFK